MVHSRFIVLSSWRIIPFQGIMRREDDEATTPQREGTSVHKAEFVICDQAISMPQWLRTASPKARAERGRASR